MPSISSQDFQDAYSMFIKSTILWLDKRITKESDNDNLGISRNKLIGLQMELLSAEAFHEIMTELSNKSIRENAALDVLIDEYCFASDLFSKFSSSEKVDGEMSKIAIEAVGSTKEILSGLPPWMKSSLKILEELLKIAIPGRCIREFIRKTLKQKGIDKANQGRIIRQRK